jgi:hypothetical protein
MGLMTRLLGWGVRCGFDDVIVYDYDKCVDILIKDYDGEEDAREMAIDYMEYNVVGAYVGSQTPLFVHRQTLEEIEESYD